MLVAAAPPTDEVNECVCGIVEHAVRQAREDAEPDERLMTVSELRRSRTIRQSMPW